MEKAGMSTYPQSLCCCVRPARSFQSLNLYRRKEERELLRYKGRIGFPAEFSWALSLILQGFLQWFISLQMSVLEHFTWQTLWWLFNLRIVQCVFGLTKPFLCIYEQPDGMGRDWTHKRKRKPKLNLGLGRAQAFKTLVKNSFSCNFSEWTFSGNLLLVCFGLLKTCTHHDFQTEVKLLLTSSLLSTKVISVFTWKSCLTPLKAPQPHHQPTPPAPQLPS